MPPAIVVGPKVVALPRGTLRNLISETILFTVERRSVFTAKNAHYGMFDT